MPELPEVETIKQQLARKLIGKRLGKRKIIGLRRRAKLLIIDFDDAASLIIHLKLTGQVIFNGQPNSYTRHVFRFKDGSRLIFNDARKFGWWKIVKDSHKLTRNFGPEALQITLVDFKGVLAKRPKTKIKLLLMDQTLVAGIGNIYSDEVLFAAGIHPTRQAKSLTDNEIKRIHKNISKILKAAIKQRGSSVEYYLDARGQKGEYKKQHKVYQKEGKACPGCGAPIKRIKLAGRSARFCSNCQPL